jgi:hypothetical protein
MMRTVFNDDKTLNVPSWVHLEPKELAHTVQCKSTVTIQHLVNEMSRLEAYVPFSIVGGLFRHL